MTIITEQTFTHFDWASEVFLVIVVLFAAMAAVVAFIDTRCTYMICKQKNAKRKEESNEEILNQLGIAKTPEEKAKIILKLLDSQYIMTAILINQGDQYDDERQRISFRNFLLEAVAKKINRF